MKAIRVVTVAALLVLLASPAIQASPPQGRGTTRQARPPKASALPALRAGAARIDITPEMPLALLGYQDPENRVSEGVHDRLYARAVALAAGTKRLVIISCDLGSLMFGPYFQRLITEKWGLREDELMLCATHTHSGPQLSLNADYPHPNNFRYTRTLERLLVDVAGRALGGMAPARMAVGRGRAAVGVSRRRIGADGRVEMAPNPDGAADDEVLVARLAATGHARAPLAVLFDYASHSRSLRGTNRLLSGDIFGIAEQVVEKAGNGRVVAAAFAGASGDVDPVSVVDGFDTPDGSAPPTVRLGTLLGEEVMRAVEGAEEVAQRAPIRTVSRRLALPPKVPGQAKWVTVTIAAVGDVAFVGLDCEASVEIGLEIKRASPFKATFVITNCNGSSGYLPTARQHEEGGYEVSRTGFGPPAAAVLVGEVVAMLTRLR